MFESKVPPVVEEVLIERQEDVTKFLIQEAEKRDREKESDESERAELDRKFLQLMKDKVKVKAEAIREEVEGPGEIQEVEKSREEDSSKKVSTFFSSLLCNGRLIIISLCHTL